MKKAFLTLGFLALLLLVRPAGAAWAPDDTLIEEGSAAKILMDFAENMPWIADGADTGKYLYVIADAGCPATKQVYTMTRKYAQELQIRWIFADMQGEGTYNSLYEERTPKTLKDAFESQVLPEDKNPKKAAKIDQYVTKGIFFQLIRKALAPSPEKFAFPTLIYGTPEKVTVSVGLEPSELDAIVKSIPAVAVKKDFTPLALTADQDTVKLRPLPAGYKYKNTNSENASMYMMPDQKAPRVGSVIPNTDWPFECKGVTEDGFIAMEIVKNGGCVYCYDPAEVTRVLAKK